MPTSRQRVVFVDGEECDARPAHLLTMRQGNIFDSVRGPGPRLTIVFGHVGFNEMGPSWRAFRDSNPCLKDIDNPFESIASPFRFDLNTWIWFVPSGPNRGMADGDLLALLDVILDWAKGRHVRCVVTNGIRDVDHGRDRVANRASDDRRTSMLTEYLNTRKRVGRMEVEVISLSGAFVRYWTT